MLSLLLPIKGVENESIHSMKTTTDSKAVATTIEPAQVVIKPLHQIRAMLVYGNDGSVQFAKGDHPNADELVEVIVDDANASESASLRAVNTLVLARMLPDVGNVKAFHHVAGKVKAKCKTESTWQNILGLVPVKDFMDVNKLPGSPFTGKNTLPYLRKVGLIDEETMKLKAGSGKDMVVKALKEGVAGNAIRPVLDAAKSKRPDLYPPKGNSSNTGKKLPSTVGVNSKNEGIPSADDRHDTVDKVSLDLQIILSRADKLAVDHLPEFRKTCGEAVRTLARLAGFDTVAIPPASPAHQVAVHGPAVVKK